MVWQLGMVWQSGMVWDTLESWVGRGWESWTAKVGKASESWESVGAWRSLVARTVRVGEVLGSNPSAPIKLLSAAGMWLATTSWICRTFVEPVLCVYRPGACPRFTFYESHAERRKPGCMGFVGRCLWPRSKVALGIAGARRHVLREKWHRLRAAASAKQNPAHGVVVLRVFGVEGPGFVDCSARLHRQLQLDRD